MTYTQPAATYIDFTLSNHGLLNGDIIFIRFKTGATTAINGSVS